MAGSTFLDCLFSCDLEKIKVHLKEMGVNAPVPDTDGFTPLHIMAGTDSVPGKEAVMVFLLENGANPNLRSDENLTPVHIAAMWNKCYELEILLQYGGNPWLTENENKNCFSLAADNYCYEALQLLHIYLHEDKFKCKAERKLSKEIESRTPISFNTTEVYEDAESKGENVAADNTFLTNANCTFMTANENFPLFFLSSDDSEDMNKFLEEKDESKQEKQFPVNEKEFTHENDVSDMSFYGTEESGDDQISKDWIYEVKNQGKSKENDFNEAYLFSSTDCDSSEFSTTDLNDSSDSNYSTFIDSDNSSGIVLVEIKTSDGSLQSTMSSCSERGDWKSYQSTKSDCSVRSYCSSHSKVSLIIPDEYDEYSNTKIFEELKKLGDNPGPILDYTRQVYLQRLVKLKSGCITCCDLPNPKYCPEIYLFIENKLDMEKAYSLEKAIAEEFDLETSKKWREGNQRCCFNYFLLDPRVTQNLPQRAYHLNKEQIFLTFLDALFYVGKGTRGRPYSHLFEAAKTSENNRPRSDKVTHILDIWNAGLGVISLHCFQNSIPVESYTREACIIEAIGLENITNIKRGDFYGISAKFTSSRKRLVGISLLNKALQIFLQEGERLLKPKDIQNK